jgi:parvulin-like peptidyl-prolyl isomerase
MKKHFMMVLCMLPSLLHAERFAVDRIKVIIHTDTPGKPSKIITESEERQIGLDGKQKNLREKINDRLIEMEGERFGINAREVAEENWEKNKKDRNMSEQQMHELLAAAGYTIEEAKEELGRMFVSNQVLGFRVYSQIFASKRDVQKYYNEHPEYRQAEYFIAHALVPYSQAVSKDELFQQLQAYRKTGLGMRIAWGEPCWFLEDEIAADKKFICSMEPGTIAEPIATYNGFEMIKLIDKRPAMLVPLQERYNTIEYELKMPKLQLELDRYTNDLLSKATIVYL